MLAAILGILGALIGFAAGSGYAFWATRRTELGAAVVAAATLVEVLLDAGDPGRLSPNVAPVGAYGNEPKAAGSACSGPTLRSTWDEQRSALAIFLPPADFRALSAGIAAAQEDPVRSKDRESLSRGLMKLHELFWSEHELFILVPLLRTLRQEEPVTTRASRVLKSTEPV
jgi:hypothetical protein